MGCHSTKELNHKLKKNPISNQVNNNNNHNNNKTDSNLVKSSKGQDALSEEEIKLIRSSWKELSKIGDFKKHGINMMIKIFINNPEIKHLWKFAAKLTTEEEMRESAQLRSHGNNVFEALNAAVNSLEKSNNVNNSLFELGKKHSLYGAKKIYFIKMREAFIEILSENLGSSFTEEHRKAWINCFDFFASQMSKGLIE